MKVEIISINPTMCREWVEKPDRDKFTLRPSYKAAKSLYKQRIDLFTTYLLISDRQYRVGEVVEVELKPSGKSGEWSKLVAIPVQQEVSEVEAVRFRDDLQVGVDRILRDKGASNKDVYDAINDVVIELSKEYNITKKAKQ